MGSVCVHLVAISHRHPELRFALAQAFRETSLQNLLDLSLGGGSRSRRRLELSDRRGLQIRLVVDFGRRDGVENGLGVVDGLRLNPD